MKTFTYKHRSYTMPQEIIDYYAVLAKDNVFERFTAEEKAKAWSALEFMIDDHFPQFNTYKSYKFLINTIHKIAVLDKMN